ncbi:MAG: anhydro-N-acetylmuramic acid kinase [Qingshengfaniella sp.]
MKEKGAPVVAVGTMSGTSLDGVDAAVLMTDGVTITDFGPGAYRPYDAGEQTILRAGLGAWPGDPGVAEAEAVVQQAHEAVLRGIEADLIGFHGQTLAHDPVGRGTHQCGDGAALARVLGRPVVWDFRTADVAAGGQGAPLAPVYHWALARWAGLKGPVAFLNLGGVGNLTWLDPGAGDPFGPGAMLAFDTGPANAPINDLCQARLGRGQDTDGALALAGIARPEHLAAFLADPYFAAPPPKSLDRDAFAGLADAVADLGDADAAATLVEALALSVSQGLALCPVAPARVLVTGGGRRNPAIMARLVALLPCPVEPVEAHGMDGDLLEAQAFAYLAVRAVRGLPITGPGTTGVAGPLTGGRLSRP